MFKLPYVDKTYRWVMHWAGTRYAPLALFGIAFVEASLFIIPPDVLLIAMSVRKPQMSFRYAFLCTLGSVLGGCFGYFLGWLSFETLGKAILKFYGLMDTFDAVGKLYKQYDAWAVAISGFTPIPYKLFTIGAGAFGISIAVFIVASIIGRALRFFLIGGLIYRYGEKIQAFIEKYLNVLTLAFVLLLLVGFVIVKGLLH